MSTVPASILFAAAAAAGFYLEMSLLAGLVKDPLALNAAIFQCLVAYTVFLTFRYRRRRPDIPALIFVLAAMLPFSGHSPWSMAVPAAAALCWIRSGGCAAGTFRRRLAAEMLCTAGGLGWVAVLAPRGLLGWTLGIWMFFLIQSLYFVANPGDAPEHEMQARLDRFEKARARAERALARLAGSSSPPFEKAGGGISR